MGISPSEFLIRELRRRRTAAGLSQGALGERIHYSDTHVSAIETGSKPPRPDYLRAVDEALDTGGLFISLWEDLVKDSAAPVWLREWIEFEREAKAFRWFEPGFVPGLLQTEAYARASLAGEMLTTDEVDQLVDSRMERQSILGRARPPLLVVALDELIVRRPAYGDRKLMAQQVEHLVGCAELPHVQIHIVPADTGMYPGLGGGFILADCDSGPVAYSDSQISAHIVNGGDVLARLAARWEGIRGETLTRQRSLDLLKEAAEQWA
ncbi:helix-turn-helix domain-containing protein [Micromonospora cathayae]|uniref:Helix-turn-helix transcriptional regulator n=1 Tax=Micromonospora cathayae TaxID=3028804 RepID=A0ABY7ZTY5_9ACTN|nr:helix-turn-helix transcriptional regulator [Micromonospora sp. HUAS 3]WDZ86495.1 helix-turn-helix transcriptional regulator [Micromonospora sp. HUAS 3]